MNQFDLKENCEKMVSRCKSMLNTCCFFISDCETEGYTCSELPLDPDIFSTYEECRVSCSTITACKNFTFYKNAPDDTNCFYFGETCTLDTKCTTPSTECTTGKIDCEGVNC